MIFQQPSQSQLTLDRPNAEPFVSKSPLATYAPVPLKSELKKHYRSFIHASEDIIAPAPKKPTQCCESSVYTSNASSFSPWGLSTLAEDSDEESFEVDLKSKIPTWNSENDAYAELLQIVRKNGQQDSRENPLDSLYENCISQTEVEPMRIVNRGLELDDMDEMFPADSSFSSDIFGRSPICRTQNPLPLDMMFSPKMSTSNISLVNPHPDLGAIPNTGDSEQLTHSCNFGRPLPLSFHKLNVRRRSLSVGARSGKIGITF
ncbi:hypothetical protein K493DRAFT_62533 [Basidiobolus meristosporus CBS 931.73]|uniref:Uncharacterized protein n=1 Tax=Basidiobolus meristosporus CBS 931.73 TaxID=1314790 RepID=A0A1Y1Z111_9FUNG|nr:hypothetical protein K493DRAFT_62533 [Basidiobolus meristosporus CBS 931.73]|eukprot:ORY03970.1 hypothetical protein K493DRAFT_62533 [Basidiobolus meristosporus CBS 931.73]